MDTTSRSYLTAGLAALTAGAIAVTPVQPAPNQLVQAPERAVSALAVNLAAVIDPITPWVDAISTAAANAYALQDTWYAKPFPILQTIAQNQFTYLSELPNIGVIFQQIVGNIGNAIRAPFTANPLNINPNPVTYVDLGGGFQIPISQQTVWAALPDALGQETYDKIKPLLDFTTTPISGFLLGFAGPGLSSMLQISETIQKILNPPLGARPLLNAINEIINLPANLFNAAWNGGKYLDLTKLVNTISPLPDTVTSIGLATGGFLNGGGVAFDALAADASLAGLSVKDPGWDVGFIGATGTLANSVANAIKVTPPQRAQARIAAAATPQQDAPAALEATAEQAASPTESHAEAAAEAPAPKRQIRRSAAAEPGSHGALTNLRAAVKAAAARRAGS